MFKLVQKLKTRKYEIKEWAKKQFGNIHDKLSKNAVKINYIEDKLLSDPTSHRLNSWIKRLIKQREKMMLFNQKYSVNLAETNG